MATRHDYYRDPNAPTPNSLVPGGSALVIDADGATPPGSAAHNPGSRYAEWTRLAATGHARLQRAVIETEAAAARIRGFDALILPGLLQTEDYARAILSRCIRFVGGLDDIAEAVAARMARRRVLRDGAHRFHFLIGEPALYTRVGAESIRIAQLEHLVEVMDLPDVTVGVVPMDSEFFYETTNFTLFDGRMAEVETISAALTVTEPRELVLYESAFTALAERSVTGDEARRSIEKAMDERVG